MKPGQVYYISHYLLKTGGLARSMSTLEPFEGADRK